MTISQQILERTQKGKDYLATKRDLWDKVEKLFNGQLNDAISDTTKSRLFDHILSTLVLDRSNRVMAQLPTGKIKGISKNDEGLEKLMNLTLDKYILPNATAQWDFITKCRMVDMYSNMYGIFYAFIDWDIKQNGYIGPDMWLLPIRDVIPQVGAVSLNDSDYVIVRSWKPISWFESIAKQKGFKNVSEIIEKLKDTGGKKATRDADQKSQREQDQYPDEAAAKGKGYHEVLSMYEKDRWVDYVVDAGKMLRDQENPHDNGELPVVEKLSIPLIDDISGIGDFERGASMQMGQNSLWNLYMDGVKLSINPPTLLNKDLIADPNSIKFMAGAKWIGRGNLANFAQALNLSPQGINSFNNTYQVMKAAILNMFSTTDTAVTSQTDPGFGKTPQAIKQQGQRENSRDNADRFYMEQFLKKVINRFINLMSKKRSTAIEMRLFDNEINELTKSYPEIKEMYDEEKGKLMIPKKKFGSVVFDYEMVSGSTYAVDQAQQQENLRSILDLFMSNPQFIQYLKERENKEVVLGELITRIMANSGIQDWDKIVKDVNDDPEAVLNNAQKQFDQAVMAMQGVNQVPPQPQGGMNATGNQAQPLQQL